MVSVNLAVVILAVALVLLGAAFILVVRALLKRIDAADERARAADERASRAPKLSRAVNMGKISEQISPLLPGFPFEVKDVQWVGGKVDAIVWNGLEAVKSGQGSPDDIEVVLLEVKTGRYARVDEDQRLIRKAADAGRVRFEVFHFRPELAPVILESGDVAPGVAVIEDELDAQLIPDDDADWDSDEKIGTDFIAAAEPPDA
jgi:predicted Holliday junction resolvase-like endonuclease